MVKINQSAASILAVILFGLTSLGAHAAGYTLSIVATNTTGLAEGFSALEEPSLNNAGEMAFWVMPAGWPRGAIIKATTNSLTVVASTQTDPSFTEVDRFPKLADNGTVVFRTFKSGAPALRQILAISGSSTQILSAGVSEMWSDSIDFDTTGVARGPGLAVSFLGLDGELLNQGVYRWSGGNLLVATEGGGQVGSILGSFGTAFGIPGQVLFGGLEGVGFDRAIFGSASLLGEALLFVDPSPNGPYPNGIASTFASNTNGALAIIGYTGVATVVDVIQGGVTNRLVEETNVFGGITRVAMNDQGTVAFLRFGSTPSGPYSGVFTGPDLIADKVVANGDAVDGLTISSVEQLNRQGINDAGQVAFLASLSNGRQAVVLATPNASPVLAADLAGIQQTLRTNITLTITGQVGAAYVVQRSTNLVNWSALTATNTLGGPAEHVTDPDAVQQRPRGFYRLLRP